MDLLDLIVPTELKLSKVDPGGLFHVPVFLRLNLLCRKLGGIGQIFGRLALPSLADLLVLRSGLAMAWATKRWTLSSMSETASSIFSSCWSGAAGTSWSS